MILGFTFITNYFPKLEIVAINASRIAILFRIQYLNETIAYSTKYRSKQFEVKRFMRLLSF